MDAAPDPFPACVDDLTSDWLQYALAEALDGEEIAGFEPEIIGVGEGFLGQLARVRLAFAGHPRLRRLSWRLGAALWSLRGLLARLHPSADVRFERRALALIGRHTHLARLELGR